MERGKAAYPVLRLQNGDLYVAFGTSLTSYEELYELAKTLGAEIIFIKGEWSFEPDSAGENSAGEDRE